MQPKNAGKHDCIRNRLIYGQSFFTGMAPSRAHSGPGMAPSRARQGWPGSGSQWATVGPRHEGRHEPRSGPRHEGRHESRSGPAWWPGGRDEKRRTRQTRGRNDQGPKRPAWPLTVPTGTPSAIRLPGQRAFPGRCANRPRPIGLIRVREVAPAGLIWEARGMAARPVGPTPYGGRRVETRSLWGFRLLHQKRSRFPDYQICPQRPRTAR